MKPYSRRTDLESNDIECIRIEIHKKYCRTNLICFMYRPPSEKVLWMDNVDNMIGKAYQENVDMLSMGDFNIDVLNNQLLL